MKKITENNTFNKIACNGIFPYYYFLPIFWTKIFSTILLFPILKVKVSFAEIVVFF